MREAFSPCGAVLKWGNTLYERRSGVAPNEQHAPWLVPMHAPGQDL